MTNHDDPLTFWDSLYSGRPTVTDPRPNARLVELATDFEPVDALDLGCGSGGDALWLARQGWQVTATDISPVAVQRLAELAGSLGLPITAVQHDLAHSFPAGQFDLVSAHYFQTPFDLDRSAVLRSAASALRPGGRLLVVDHGSSAPWSWNQDPEARFPGPLEIAAGLALDPQIWTVERADSPRRTATGPGGQTAEVIDHVLVIRRSRP
ncbi:methyltransferase domain-containing protein [Kineosporia sp. NBRC 101677]|uniref:class I SAM-dependent methyltransferase n=1 Tax=Kineosporia sp. NBRC 101677 TaxID=3032197 RepID=UPI00255413F7|nr:methyltransferase domain-containing protein [Kineosporia sp. NBRC 101677]